MEDLDKEIKQIQLRRELLAFEREKLALAREKGLERLKNVLLTIPVDLVVSGVRLFRQLLAKLHQMFKRWWKALAVCAALAVLIAGGIAWKELVEKERLAAIQAKRFAAQEAYVLKACGKKCVDDGSVRSYFVCPEQNSKYYYPCESAAIQSFEREWAR